MLTADLSHYLVGREFRYPVSDENHALIHRILERTDAFHGRVAAREQVQVSIGFPQHRKWLDVFLGWWEEGFRRWRARAAADATCIFVVELGPGPDYAITGADGLELSDRWAEALQMRDLVRERWDEVAAETAESRCISAQSRHTLAARWLVAYERMFATREGTVDQARERRREARRREVRAICEQQARLAQRLTEIVREADDEGDWERRAALRARSGWRRSPAATTAPRRGSRAPAARCAACPRSTRRSAAAP